MTDWGEFYRHHVAALAGLAPDLTDEQVGTDVPATPDWTVEQVLAHLAGESSDLVEDRMDGAPSKEWTSKQVDDRSGTAVADLVAELRGNADAVAASLADAKPPAFAWDIAVHHADLHEALGKGRPPESLWMPVVDAVRPMAPEEVRDVEPYELFRGFFSRRSRGQMAAWGSGADDEALAGMCVFGPRDDDQPLV